MEATRLQATCWVLSSRAGQHQAHGHRQRHPSISVTCHPCTLLSCHNCHLHVSTGLGQRRTSPYTQAHTQPCTPLHMSCSHWERSTLEEPCHLPLRVCLSTFYQSMFAAHKDCVPCGELVHGCISVLCMSLPLPLPASTDPVPFRVPLLPAKEGRSSACPTPRTLTIKIWKERKEHGGWEETKLVLGPQCLCSLCLCGCPVLAPSARVKFPRTCEP